jgi:hypothetical protein
MEVVVAPNRPYRGLLEALKGTFGEGRGSRSMAKELLNAPNPKPPEPGQNPQSDPPVRDPPFDPPDERPLIDPLPSNADQPRM